MKALIDWALCPVNWFVDKKYSTWVIPSLLLATTFGISIADKFSAPWWRLNITALVVSLINIYASFRKKAQQDEFESLQLKYQESCTKNEKLAEENSILKTFAPRLCEILLRDIAVSRLDFSGSSPQEERVSLYVHDSDSNFRIVARFSLNPDLQKLGRDRHPDPQGVIGRAWRDSIVIQKMPQKASEWVRKCTNTFGIPREVAEAIRMKSVLYGATRLTAPNGEHLAIIVVETRRSAKYTNKVLRQYLQETFVEENNNPIRTQLIHLIQQLRPWLTQ